GAAGTSVTVIGQNFSGAGGHLQVLFGNTAATSVTVVDDSHVTAVVPNGSGTVDVRVQSGVTTAANPDHIKSTIFGHGTAAISAGDVSPFGASRSNQAPPVAPPAVGSPNPVTGKTTNLSVLGADDGGAANLIYTWSLANGPAAVSFSANGSNAAQN